MAVLSHVALFIFVREGLLPSSSFCHRPKVRFTRPFVDGLSSLAFVGHSAVESHGPKRGSFGNKVWGQDCFL